MNILLLILLLLPTTTLGGTFAGYSHTKHIASSSLNDIHPYRGYQSGDYGMIMYLNSFDIRSAAIYRDIPTPVTRSIYLNLRIGVTTGYTKVMYYKGGRYELIVPVYKNSLALMPVPSINKSIGDRYTLSLGLVGDAVSIDWQVNLN